MLLALLTSLRRFVSFHPHWPASKSIFDRFSLPHGCSATYAQVARNFSLEIHFPATRQAVAFREQVSIFCRVVDSWAAHSTLLWRHTHEHLLLSRPETIRRSRDERSRRGWVERSL